MNRFACRARSEGTPLIDGDTATFIWLGDQAPMLVGDFTDWEHGLPVSMERVTKKVWIYQQKFPLDAYLEYAFFRSKEIYHPVEPHKRQERLTDPFNPRTTPNGIGGKNNYFYMPQGEPASLAKPRRQVERGVVTKLSLNTENLLASNQRTVWLYQPAVQQKVPLVVVWDGKDYRKRAHLPVIVDNLIAERHIQPVGLAMIENGGPSRMVEYACSESTLCFLLKILLPIAQSELNLIDIQANPGTFAVMGASMGGLMALFSALRLPHIFDKVLSQSGAFQFWDYGSLVFDLVRLADPKSVRLWLDVGLYDIPSIIEVNFRMQTLLANRGFTFDYRHYPAGHNYPAWRNELWRGLEYLFPYIK